MGKVLIIKCYHCSNSCKHSGCPGHNAVIEYNTKKKKYQFDDGKGKKLFFLEKELDYYIERLRDLNYKA